MTNPLSSRFLYAAMLASACVTAFSGCSNRAHSDLYRQRMANEIRVLEDQLYDADYQNRVLQDKLQQVQNSKHANAEPPLHHRHSSPRPANPTPSAPFGPHVAPTPDPNPDSAEGFLNMGRGLENEPSQEPELELPTFDEGIPVAPGDLKNRQIQPVPLRDAGAKKTQPDESAKEKEDSEHFGLLPAPGGPEPPGKKDTLVPLVEEGPVLPPPAKEEGEIKPPNQIILPESVQASTGAPEKLRLHHGLSGGTRSDGKIPGMTVVVNVVDQVGKTVDLKKFEIEAEMSVVILDPEREGEEAKIGRWDFSPEEVETLIESTPISGFHVPVRWETQPVGKEVIVHVRLRGEDDELRCEGRLKVEKKTVIADWTPRGDSIR